MLLYPQKLKYNKSFSNKKIKTSKLVKPLKTNFSHLSLISAKSGRISNFQLEALRKFLRRYLKKKAQIFFRVFPNTPITKKPNEVRLGRGKANLNY